MVKRRSDGSSVLSVNRKPTWTGQYLYFATFVLMTYKQRLVETLARAENFDPKRRSYFPHGCAFPIKVSVTSVSKITLNQRVTHLRHLNMRGNLCCYSSFHRRWCEKMTRRRLHCLNRTFQCVRAVIVSKTNRNSFLKIKKRTSLAFTSHFIYNVNLIANFHIWVKRNIT